MNNIAITLYVDYYYPSERTMNSMLHEVTSKTVACCNHGPFVEDAVAVVTASGYAGHPEVKN
jgi:hypothetical protein